MRSHTLRLLLVAIIAGVTGYYIGINKVSIDWKNYKPHVEMTGKTPPPSVMHGDFNQFWTVLEKLEENYYDKKAIEPQKIINGAISGMVNSLDDPYTVYLPPKQNTDFKQGLAGKFEGIGAELGMKEKQIVVVAPLDGSPAEKAGIKPADEILKVNDEFTAGWTLNQAVEKIRGDKGTPVRLTVLHKGAERPVEIKIIRDTIQVKSLVSSTKKIKDIEAIKMSPLLKQHANEEVIYLRLSQFGDTTNNEWLQMTNKIDRDLKTNKNIKGIVLDLRNNPGGYLQDAVYIASEFIKSGTAVMQEDKNLERQSYPVSGKGLLTNVPVVVLINKGSASASEIVSGALRDHKRAKLVGETSYGKGTIQEAEDLGNQGAGLHVTIAKWLTPNGTWVGDGKKGSGLKPDVVVEVDNKDQSHDAQLEKAIEELLK